MPGISPIMRQKSLPPESPGRSLALLGPTCSWKSELAIRIAEDISGEIISCDSMQVYRGMDIGTAKPSAEQRQRIPHHLLDILDIQEPFCASQFVVLAEKAQEELTIRGKTAVLAGGTGLYAKALIYGMEMHPADSSVYHQLEKEFANPNGPDRLRQELLSAAENAEHVPADILKNSRRMLRALEILRISGGLPWTTTRRNSESPSKANGAQFTQVIIMPTNVVLRQRIAQRTSEMLASGWIEETEYLITRGLMHAPTARQALGYAEIAAYLGGGPPGNRTELMEAIVSKTMKFARRQKTWFKHQHPGAAYITVDCTQPDIRELQHTVLNACRQPQSCP